MSQPSSGQPAEPDQRSLVWRVLVDDAKHGPLPWMLLILTAVTGIVDAVSILRLGRVFVANMTGNVVFVGFALAHSPGFSLAASLFALAGFMVGAAAGGWLTAHHGDDRAVLLRAGVALELALIVVSLIVAASAGDPVTGPARDAIAAMSAIAMGIQNAVARRLAVPDLTTTVLTMTLTGLAADIRAANRGPALLRRLLAVGTMLGGAIAGAEIVLHGSVVAAYALAAGLLAVVTATAALATRREQIWRHG
jgi:uncharacterized membrane protein YoaK (UPF0700 family)